MAQRTLKGIDGWLLAFMAALIVAALVALMLFVMGLRAISAWEDFHGPMPLSVKLSGWVYNGVNIAGPPAIFWRMLRVKRWTSIQLAVAGLWLVYVGNPLIDFAYTALTMPGTFGGLLPLLIHSLLGKALLALGGTFYLLGSVRVANTYPRADAPELLGELFE